MFDHDTREPPAKSENFPLSGDGHGASGRGTFSNESLVFLHGLSNEHTYADELISHQRATTVTSSGQLQLVHSKLSNSK